MTTHRIIVTDLEAKGVPFREDVHKEGNHEVVSVTILPNPAGISGTLYSRREP